MNTQEHKESNVLTVHVKYRNLEQTFTGNPDTVLQAVNRFFNDTFPALSLAQRLALTVDTQKLVENVADIIAFTAEGPRVLVPKERLTDNEVLTLNLLAVYLGHKLAVIESDVASKDELQARLGKKDKIATTRLGELVRKDIVAKTEEGKYRITGLGIKYLQDELLPRIKEKIV